jgi:hypothetical protein
VVIRALVIVAAIKREVMAANVGVAKIIGAKVIVSALNR